MAIGAQGMGQTSFEQTDISNSSPGSEYSASLVNEIVTLHSLSGRRSLSSRSTNPSSDFSAGSLEVTNPFSNSTTAEGTQSRLADCLAPTNPNPLTDDDRNAMLFDGFNETKNMYSDSISALLQVDSGSRLGARDHLLGRSSFNSGGGTASIAGPLSEIAQREQTVRSAGLPPTARLMRDLWEHGNPT